MERITSRLTYANVMSSLAVFLVLGGAAAFAATHFGKNSVGTKQLKRNAVTKAKIRKNAVTTAKIKNGAVTGAKLNVPTIPTVPSAANAGNAGTVGGQSVVKLFKTLSEGESDVLVATAGGFNFIGSCEANDADLEVVGPPSSTAWTMEAGGIPGNLDNKTTDAYASAKPNEEGSIRVDTLSSGGDAAFGTTTFYAARSDGTVVSGDLGYDYDTFNEVAPNTCLFAGHLIVG